MALSRTVAIKVYVLVLLSGLAIAVVLLLVPPWPQDPNYHNFADQRSIWGVPHFFDVVSNLPFFFIGAAGLRFLARGRPSTGLNASEDHHRMSDVDRWSFGTMFIGVLFTAFGSAYYHWAPDSRTLFWDRLPMSIGFMGFLAGMIGERISPKAGRRLLLPLVLLGVVSVVYWQVGERRGAGDLRFYGLVQFFPLVVLLYLLALFPAHDLPSGDILGVMGWYALAKILEALDHRIYACGHVVSGHTLKHLAAAMGTLWLLRTLSRLRRSDTACDA